VARDALESAPAPGIEMRGADLRWARLRGADLRGADLRDADLLDADLYHAQLSGARLSGAKLLAADLRGADLRGAELVRADLREARLRGADLREADLASAALAFADLREASLERARLARADLSHVLLQRARLAGVDLSRAEIGGADLREARGLEQAQLDSACADRGTRVDPVSALRPGGLRPPAEREPACSQRAFVMDRGHAGPEDYSSWFADTDGALLFFGLSPFWSALDAKGDPRAELEQPGPHRIGRFDLATRRFLPPLVVRTVEQGARGSVWDVLVHSSGRLYYTTFFQEMGVVSADGTEVVHFDALGTGLNELVEGERGEIVVTRYGTGGGDGRHRGGVVWVSPKGELLHETGFPETEGVRIAPKSLAVDPGSGEVWLNADRFGAAGEFGYAWMRLDRDGRALGPPSASPELLFPAFDREGRGWFVWDEGGQVVLRVRQGGRELAHVTLEPREPSDFAQDLRFAPDGRALIAMWSGRVHVAELSPGGELRVRTVRFERPPECQARRALFYTAIAHAGRIYSTLSCDGLVLSLPLEEAAR
jgi:hypothetical protein